MWVLLSVQRSLVYLSVAQFKTLSSFIVVDNRFQDSALGGATRKARVLPKPGTNGQFCLGNLVEKIVNRLLYDFLELMGISTERGGFSIQAADD